MSFRIGVISDTHGDLAGWHRALSGPLGRVDCIVHAGDLLYHGPKNPMVAGYDPAGLAEAMNALDVPLIVAKGNCDSAVDQLVLRAPIQSPYAFLQMEGLRVLVHHGDGLTEADRRTLGEQWAIDVFVTGHTHARLLERVGKTIMLNPGSPALPKSDGTLDPVPTVATVEPQRVRIWSLESGEAVCDLAR